MPTLTKAFLLLAIAGILASATSLAAQSRRSDTKPSVPAQLQSANPGGTHHEDWTGVEIIKPNGDAMCYDEDHQVSCPGRCPCE